MRNSKKVLLGVLCGQVASGTVFGQQEVDVWTLTRAVCFAGKAQYLSDPARRAKFDKMVESGRAWDETYVKQLKYAREFPDTACASWEGSNGSEKLGQFLRDYSSMASTIVSLQEEAVGFLAPNLEAWEAVGEAIMASNRQMKDFKKTLCGQGLELIRQDLDDKRQLMEALTVGVGQACADKVSQVQGLDPKIKDMVYGAGSSKPLKSAMASVKHERPRSTLTGVEQALAEEARAKELTGR